MRLATEHDYRRRTARVAEHLAAHLDAPLDLDRLAAIACFSPAHFHRIYTAVTGETVADTVRRLRLHRASGELRENRLPLERIATRAGYGSLAAFSRAFKTAYGLPPARWRDARRPEVPLGLPLCGVNTMSSSTALPVEIRDLPSLRLAVVPHVGPYMEIGRAFETLAGIAGPAGLFRADTATIGVYLDDPAAVPASRLRAEAGLTVADAVPLPAGLGERRLPGGRHAVWTHRGPYVDLEEAYRRLYGEWLPASGEEAADRPCFEIYLNDPRTTAPLDLVTEICLPLAPRAVG